MITLGKAETSKEEALLRYDLLSCTDDDEESEPNSDSTITVTLDVVTELMFKICGVEWNMSTQRLIASSSNYLYHESPTIDWFRNLIDNDQMIDAFRFYHPNAHGRFTCWNQYTNKRFVNDGARIDYTLVDKELEPFMKQGAPLRGDAGSDPNTDTAAFHAVTANGGYKAASFDGSGIAVASQEALDSQFGPLHTGMIYTPPSYSDHIAVSLLLDDSLTTGKVLQLDETDRLTRKAQPHKSQSSIKSFFSGDCNRIKNSDLKHQLSSVGSILQKEKVIKTTTKTIFKKAEKTSANKILKRTSELNEKDETGVHRKTQRTEITTTSYRWFQPKKPKNGKT